MTFKDVIWVGIPESSLNNRVVKIKCGDTVLWEYKTINMVKFATEADGVTIYNNGLGYKDGYRIRSGGGEGAHSTASHTGFILVEQGDVIGIGGVDLTDRGDTDNAINVYNQNFENLGQVVENMTNSGYGIFADGKLSSWSKGVKKNGCLYWTVPNNGATTSDRICYIRVTGRTNGDGSKMIVTRNWEIA